MAEPGQLVGIAELGGGHHFVELDGIGLVGRLPPLPRLRAGIQAAGFVAVVLALAHRGVRIVVGFLRGVGVLARLRVGLALAVRVHLLAALGFARLARVVVFRLFRARLVLRVVRVFDVLVCEVQLLDQQPRVPGEGGLVVHGAREVPRPRAALRLEPGPPEIGHVAGGRRQRPAGERLAHQEGQRLGDRDFLGCGALAVALAATVLLEGRIEIGRDAREPPRADGFHPRLLDRVEDRARRPAARPRPGVGGFVVMAQPQRQGVGRAAHQLHVQRVELARGERQLDMAARDPGLLRVERDLERALRLAGDRPQGGADGPLEGLDRAFPPGHGRGPAQALGPAGAEDSGSSIPRQRWKYSATIGRSISSHLFTKVVRKA